jgi:HD-GYP domain-containing protein (c-di-GMP phosphodiesterase class II)
VHIADALDSMVTDRHYRHALTVPEAVLELRVNSGTQFDPAITPVVLRLIEAGLLEEGKPELVPSSQGLVEAHRELDREPVEVMAR